MDAAKEDNSLHLEHVPKDVEVGTKDEQEVQVTATEEAFIRKKVWMAPYIMSNGLTLMDD